MKSVLPVFCLFSLNLCFPANYALAQESIKVVANTSGKEITLNKQEVRNLFMGGALTHDLRAIVLPPENKTRVLFNTKVIGLTESRIQSYWAQMWFSGRKRPPKELSDEQSIITYLLRNEGTAGYVAADFSIPEELTVVFTSN